MRPADYVLQARIIELARSGKGNEATDLMYRHYKIDLLRELSRGTWRFIVTATNREDAITDAILETSEHIEKSEEGISGLFYYIRERAFNKLRNSNRVSRLFYSNFTSLDDTTYNYERLIQDLSEHQGTGNGRIFTEFRAFRQLDPKCQKRISLFLEQGFSHREITKMMPPPSEAAARKQYSRCIDKLRKLMKK